MLSELCDQYEQGTEPGHNRSADSKVAVLEPPQPTLAPSSPASLADQIKRLKDECDITAEELAEALGVVPRSIFKHLAGTTIPRRGHLAAYERLFTARLQRTVTFQKVSKRS
jgi:hypothetical protein